MATRSGPKSIATSSAMSAIEILERERAVRELRQAFHASIGLRECAGGFPEMRDALLEEGERIAQVEPLLVELAHDLLEAGEGLFERHREGSGRARTSRAVASISPSHSRTMNSRPAV